MKSFLILAAFAGTAYVGYSYNLTDGESCMVCPMTGEPLLTSAAAEPDAPCCSGQTGAMLTSADSGAPSCCSQSGPACCSEGDAAMLTSTPEAGCSKGDACCSKSDAALLTSTPEAGCSKGDACCSKTDSAMLASTCESGCTKGCCQDKEAVTDADTASEDVVAEVAETE